MRNDTIDFTAKRARLAKVEAELAELKAAMARGELIPVDEFQCVATATLEHAGKAMLEMAVNLVPLVTAATTETEVKAIMEIAFLNTINEIFDDAMGAIRRGVVANDPDGPEAA